MSKQLNPKLLISQYFDSLIRQIDIFTEEKLKEYRESDNLTIPKRQPFRQYLDKTIQDDTEIFNSEYQDSIFENLSDIKRYWQSLFMKNSDYESNLNIPEKDTTVNMIDYLNQEREKMLAELANGQEEVFKRYETINDDLREIKDNDKLMEQLFANKFYLLVEYEVSERENREKKNKTQHLLVFNFYLNERNQTVFRYFKYF